MTDRAWRNLSRAFREQGLPKIMESAVCVSVYGGPGDDFDMKFALQIGAMVLLDKPIVVVAVPGAKVPGKVRLVADEVIEDWGPENRAAQDRLTEAVLRFREDG